MVATDTVVGIVGAVVLVAVMAGVFVYEYNNAPETAMSDAQAQAHFEEDYLGLAATQDIDGDGTANYLDNDLDGDGLNNTDDEDVAIVLPVSASVAASTPAAPGQPYRLEFYLGNGTEHLEGTLTYQRIAPVVPLPAFNARIVDASGQAVGVATTTAPAATGTSVTMNFDISEVLPAGTYTLEISHGQAGPQATVNGMLTVHYTSPAEPHDH